MNGVPFMVLLGWMGTALSAGAAVWMLTIYRHRIAKIWGAWIFLGAFFAESVAYALHREPIAFAIGASQIQTLGALLALIQLRPWSGDKP